MKHAWQHTKHQSLEVLHPFHSGHNRKIFTKAKISGARPVFARNVIQKQSGLQKNASEPLFFFMYADKTVLSFLLKGDSKVVKWSLLGISTPLFAVGVRYNICIAAEVVQTQLKSETILVEDVHWTICQSQVVYYPFSFFFKRWW